MGNRCAIQVDGPLHEPHIASVAAFFGATLLGKDGRAETARVKLVTAPVFGVTLLLGRRGLLPPEGCLERGWGQGKSLPC
eukprot:gene20538-biopygen22126